MSAAQGSCRVQRVVERGRESWTVIGVDRRPVESVDRYLGWLTNIEKSPDTVRAYACDLKLFVAFLAARDLAWDEVSLEALGAFTAWLRQPAESVIVLEQGTPARTASSVNRTLSAVFGFYEFHARSGVTLARADAERPEIDGWVAGAGPLRALRPIRVCEAPECPRSSHHAGRCRTHEYVMDRPPRVGDWVCRVFDCAFPAEPGRLLCDAHEERFRVRLQTRHVSLETFVAEIRADRERAAGAYVTRPRAARCGSSCSICCSTRPTRAGRCSSDASTTSSRCSPGSPSPRCWIARLASGAGSVIARLASGRCGSGRCWSTCTSGCASCGTRRSIRGHRTGGGSRGCRSAATICTTGRTR